MHSIGLAGFVYVYFLYLLHVSIHVGIAFEYVDKVQEAFDNLDNFYINGSGFYNGMEDWHNANILEQTANWIELGAGGNESEKNKRLAIIDAMYANQIVNTTCDGNMFNDDVLWFVLGWYRAYEVTGKEAYLNRSKDLYNCVLYAWDKTCGGGLYWNYWEIYKNAVTNSLFVIASEKLQTEWYMKARKWWLHSGMLGGDNLVYDGLNKSCQNNRHTVWTYNMGLSLWFLDDIMAENVLTDGIRYFDIYGKGVLTELCEVASNKCNPPCSYCNNDQKQFKGILIRYMWYRGINGYRKVVADNLATVLDSYKDGWYGVSWMGIKGLSEEVDYITQSSVLDLLLAGYGLQITDYRILITGY